MIDKTEGEMVDFTPVITMQTLFRQHFRDILKSIIPIFRMDHIGDRIESKGRMYAVTP